MVLVMVCGTAAAVAMITLGVPIITVALGFTSVANSSDGPSMILPIWRKYY